MIFPSVKLQLYQELYKDLPENTIADKIIKMRKMNNLEREEFADIISHHLSTVKAWETENIPPNPSSIKDICTKFNIPLNYFHEYYSIYFSNYAEKLRDWKNINNYNYNQVTEILKLSHSGFARLLSGKINLSYDMYLKLKDIKII